MPVVAVQLAVLPSHMARGRWIWWLLAGSLALVVALTSTGIVLVSDYQPFRRGYKQYGPPPGVEAGVVSVDRLGLAIFLH